MKTAISLPNKIFKEAESFARRTRRSRSELYRAALQEYLARHAPDSVTEAANRAVDALGAAAKEDFTGGAARRILKRTEW